MSINRPLLSLILAAGEGTRMKSTLPKVLHKVGGCAMLEHVMRAALSAGSDKLAVVIGPERDDVAQLVHKIAQNSAVYVQSQRLGTAHATLQARESLETHQGDVIIAFGDTPLLSADTFTALRKPLAEGAAIVVGAFIAPDPTGYGRVLLDDGQVLAIREEKEATPEQRQVQLVNGGLLALDATHALHLLDMIDNHNSKGEYYLTDIVEKAVAQGLRVAHVVIDAQEVLGVNHRGQLAECEQIFQQRMRQKWLMEGVTMVAPETVFFNADTMLAPDVWIGPHVVFGAQVSIQNGVKILGFCHITGAKIEKNARIGPFARLRPQTQIGEEVHIGNFVEINRSTLEARVEVNHLTYLGDAQVGCGSNIGAGTITCNFDGADKHPTKIGRECFIGSNATLVAPLNIGHEVLVAAASVVTQDAPDGALIFGRVKEQTVMDGVGVRKIKANRVKRAERKARGG